MIRNIFGLISTVSVGTVIFGFLIPFCCSNPIALLLGKTVKNNIKLEVIFFIIHFFLYGPILWFSIKAGYIIPFQSPSWPALSNPSAREVTIILFMTCALFTLPVWWLFSYRKESLEKRPEKHTLSIAVVNLDNNNIKKQDKSSQ